MGEFLSFFTLREVIIILVVFGFTRSTCAKKRKGKKKPKRKRIKK